MTSTHILPPLSPFCDLQSSRKCSATWAMSGSEAYQSAPLMEITVRFTTPNIDLTVCRQSGFGLEVRSIEDVVATSFAPRRRRMSASSLQAALKWKLKQIAWRRLYEMFREWLIVPLSTEA